MNRRKKLLSYLLGFSIALVLLVAFGSVQLGKENGVLALISYGVAFICVLGQMMSLALLSRLSKQSSD